MRNKLHITLYLTIAIFVCVLLSCGRAREEKMDESVEMERMPPPPTVDETEAAADNMLSDTELEESFNTDTLNEEQLNIFQKRAQQKLQDFINYIEIISNKRYNSQLRLAASQQIEELFADSSVIVDVTFDAVEQEPRTISIFIKDVFNCTYDSIKIKNSSVMISPAQKTGNAMEYSGYISADITIMGYKESNIVFSSIANHKAITIIRKQEKQFGKETQTLWTVVIGQLN